MSPLVVHFVQFFGHFYTVLPVAASKIGFLSVIGSSITGLFAMYDNEPNASNSSLFVTRNFIFCASLCSLQKVSRNIHICIYLNMHYLLIPNT